MGRSLPQPILDMSNGASVRKKDPFGARDTFETGSGAAYLYRLDCLEALGYSIDRLPFSIRVLLEALLRRCDGFAVTEDDVVRLAQYDPKAPAREDIPFTPARVLLQDFTGVPAVVDLASVLKIPHHGLYCSIDLRPLGKLFRHEVRIKRNQIMNA